MKAKNLDGIGTQAKKTVKPDNKLCINKAVGDGISQSERFIAKARELGLDEREEAFDAALTKAARHQIQPAFEASQHPKQTPSDR